MMILACTSLLSIFLLVVIYFVYTPYTYLVMHILLRLCEFFGVGSVFIILSYRTSPEGVSQERSTRGHSTLVYARSTLGNQEEMANVGMYQENEIEKKKLSITVSGVFELINV
jgi:hypothetical protein